MNTIDNIIIATRIGMQKTELGWYDAEDVLVKVGNDNNFELLFFDKSWDWLVPAISFVTIDDVGIGGFYEELTFEVATAVIENDLTRAYKALVEYIINTKN